MKKAITLIILTLIVALRAQIVPQAFNYQGIARDAQGTSLSSKQLGIRITLQEKNGLTTTDVYSETHFVTTNLFGLFNLSIGRGISGLGNFSAVNFANKNISVKTEIDPNGGSNYTLSGNSELLSVPYALVAGNSGTNYWNKNLALNLLYVNTNEKIGIGTDSPTATIDLVGTAKFGTLASSTTNTRLLTADVSGNLAFRELSTFNVNPIWTKNSTNNTVYTNNGEKVGIGTDNPQNGVHLKAPSSGSEMYNSYFLAEASQNGEDATAGLLINVGGKGIGEVQGYGENFFPLGGARNGYITVTGLYKGVLLTAMNLSDTATKRANIRFLTGAKPLDNNQPKDRMIISGDGDVGIGTMTPSARLEVVGSVKFGSLNTSSSNTRLLTADSDGNLAFREMSTITSSSSIWTKNSPNNTVYTNNGEKVGINTVPNEILHTNLKDGNARFDCGAQINGQSSADVFNIGLFNKLAISYRPMSISNPWFHIHHTLNSSLQFSSGFSPGDSPILTLNVKGEIGMGTTNPSATLDLVGTAKFSTLPNSTSNTRLLSADSVGNLAFREMSTITSLNNSQWVNTANGIQYKSGQVSIGNTTTLNADLMISKNATLNTNRTLLALENTSNQDNSSCGLSVISGTGSNQTSILIATHAKSYLPTLQNSGCGAVNSEKLALISMPNNTTSEGYIKFVTGGNIATDANGGVERMRITSDGKIGMGTANPTATLDIVGTAKFGTLASSTTNTKLLTADASGNLAFRDLSSISGAFNGGEMEVVTGVENPKTIRVYAGLHVNNSRTRMGYINTFSDFNASDIYFNAWKNSDYFPQRITPGYVSGISFGHGLNNLGDFGGDITIFSTPPGPAGEVITSARTLIYLRNNGNIGLSTRDPKSKLHVSQGDIYIDDASKGIIMKSPDGQCWRVTVSNTGSFTSTSVTCP